MKVLIGTQNPGKVQALENALNHFYKDFEIITINTSSGVPDEPINEQTLTGARNRVLSLEKYAKENNLDANFYCAIESGMINLYGNWYIANIAVIKDKNGYESSGTGAMFPVPNKYVSLIKEKSLGKVFDEILNAHELSKGKGGINTITHNTISRLDISESAFIMALTQFINEDLWHD